jgi:hypothetical protein
MQPFFAADLRNPSGMLLRKVDGSLEETTALDGTVRCRGDFWQVSQMVSSGQQYQLRLPGGATYRIDITSSSGGPPGPTTYNFEGVKL